MEERYLTMAPDELRAELQNIEGAINNEKIWTLGSFGDERMMHEANIAMLVEEMEYVRELLQNTEVWLS